MHHRMAPFTTKAKQFVVYLENQLQQGKMTDDLVRSADMLSLCHFYLGDHERAIELAFEHSRYRERMINDDNPANGGIYPLFMAGLYRDLAQHHEVAVVLWQRLIDWRRESWTEADIYRNWLGWRIGCAWVHEAYALAKLGRFAEVEEPARVGFHAICRGKGIDPTPHKNAREFGLVNVLIELSAYKLARGEEQKEKAQKALLTYKKQNYLHGRLGYPVIFDLQFSYPEIFTQVLPGPDPEKD